MSVLNALWRVLFCAIAVSCTLSRNAQGQRLDRLKDLICVLYLSGLQKEDLDMSLLTKLQRYNININEISNEELRNICGSGKLTTTSATIEATAPYKVKSLIIKDSKSPSAEYVNDIDNSTIQTNNRRMVGYAEDQPDIKSVLNFWRNVEQHSIAKETDEVHKKDTLPSSQLSSDRLLNNFNDTEILKKIISDGHKNQYQTMETNKRIIPDKYNFERIEIDHKSGPIYFNAQPPHFERNVAYKAYEKVHYENKEVKQPTEQKIDYILNTINQFKSMLSNINSSKNNLHPHNNVTKLPEKEKLNPSMNQNKLEPSNLTDDLVKKIAQSVKDMVLQDLRKEMQITTRTTTHKAETVTLIQNDLVNDENIMINLMKMLQPLKQPVLKNKDQIIRTIQPIRLYEVNNVNKYDQIKQKNVNGQHGTIILTPQIQKFKTNVQNSQQNVLRPITFQTNSLEIPPLGIPIRNGQNLINQNIIVTTSAPFKIHYESDNAPSYSDSALMKVYPKDVLQSPLSAKFSKRSDDCPLNHPCNHKNEDIIRFRISNDGKTKYDTDYYEKINLGRIKPNNGYAPRAPRFHEKLERADRYELGEMNEDCCRYPITQQMVDCCNEKIASRQPTSMAKKRGSYDDTHFRNFLKTQQKVTDMLEQILASKTREMPVSVETT